MKSFVLAKEGLFINDDTVVSDCLWTICYMVETDDDNIIGIVASADVIHVITEALVSPDPILFTPALKAIGSILTTNDHEVIDRCLWSGCL